MKKSFPEFLIFIILIVASCTKNGEIKTYYVSIAGSDDNSGLSKKEAWKTIEKVNQVNFRPGDFILFEAGGVWKGQLRPKGSGEKGKPITISSFAKGPRPVINIGEEPGTGIHLVNQSWWEIKGIEITSGAPPELGVKRDGIIYEVSGEGTQIEHLVISDCYIHDIWGQVGGVNTSYAIQVGKQNRRDNCTINDVLIEDNIIKRIDKVAIRVQAQNDVNIRRNYMENIGGDGIILSGAKKGIIEYNIADRTCLRSGDPDIERGGEVWWNPTAAIWLANCTETIMQFNEVYNTGRKPYNGDGMAYDFDFDCKNCILQYNYSAYNLGGWLLIMNRAYNNIARYNISQNDEIHLVQMRGPASDGNLVYNNVFYVDHGTLYIDYFGGEYDEKDTTLVVPNYRNNIFYATGQGRFRSVNTNAIERPRSDMLPSLLVPINEEQNTLKHHNRQFGSYWNNDLNIRYPADGLFLHNCYFGEWKNGYPNDPEAIISDPLMVAPGTGGIGLSTLDVYSLQAGSPCINTGIPIEMNGGRDFFGKPLSQGTVDIGAIEF